MLSLFWVGKCSHIVCTVIWNRQSREANVEFFLHALLTLPITCSQLYTCQLYRGTCKRRTADDFDAISGYFGLDSGSAIK